MRLNDRDLGPADFDLLIDYVIDCEAAHQIYCRLYSVRLVLFSGLSMGAACEVVGVAKRTVSRWTRSYREQGLIALIGPSI